MASMKEEPRHACTKNSLGLPASERLWRKGWRRASSSSGPSTPYTRPSSPWLRIAHTKQSAAAWSARAARNSACRMHWAVQLCASVTWKPSRRRLNSRLAASLSEPSRHGISSRGSNRLLLMMMAVPLDSWSMRYSGSSAHNTQILSHCTQLILALFHSYYTLITSFLFLSFCNLINLNNLCIYDSVFFNLISVIQIHFWTIKYFQTFFEMILIWAILWQQVMSVILRNTQQKSNKAYFFLFTKPDLTCLYLIIQTFMNSLRKKIHIQK